MDLPFRLTNAVSSLWMRDFTPCAGLHSKADSRIFIHRLLQLAPSSIQAITLALAYMSRLEASHKLWFQRLASGSPWSSCPERLVFALSLMVSHKYLADHRQAKLNPRKLSSTLRMNPKQIQVLEIQYLRMLNYQVREDENCLPSSAFSRRLLQC